MIGSKIPPDQNLAVAFDCDGVNIACYPVDRNVRIETTVQDGESSDADGDYESADGDFENADGEYENAIGKRTKKRKVSKKGTKKGGKKKRSAEVKAAKREARKSRAKSRISSKKKAVRISQSTKVSKSLNPQFGKDYIVIPEKEINASSANGETGLIALDDINDFDAPRENEYSLASGSPLKNVNWKGVLIGVAIAGLAIYGAKKAKLF